MFYKLIFTGVLATTLVLAQGRGGGGGGGMGGGDSSGGMGSVSGMGSGEGIQMPRVTTRLDRISEALKLNKDQKKEVKSILERCGPRRCRPAPAGARTDRTARPA